ncbi:DUF4153 domain-containing protein [Streptomyces phaeochromogenes]|uniref:DUF4153 domain-containing protein n=1 Tax=Streptomyces phaeochromogenes TaxID=1923 RepID=UPI003868B7A2
MSDTPSEAEPRGSASKDSGVKPGIDAGEPEIPEAPKVPEGPADEVPAARTGGALSKGGSARGAARGSASGGTGSGGTDFEKRKAQARHVDTRDVDTRDVDTPDLDEDEEWDGPVVESWFADVQAKPPAPIRDATLWAALATGVLSMLLLGDGLALNLLLVAIPAALGAYYAAQAAGRRPHRWTLVWGVGGLALLSVPALRDADWPSFLAVLAAVAAGSLALHGGRTWTGVLFGPIGLYTSLVTGPLWGWSGLRERSGGARGNVGPVVRAIAVAAVLLVVFGALFAGADAAFADLLGGLVPDASVSGGPWHAVLFVIGVVGALVVAHTAAAPVQWDRVEVPAGRPRGRVEWALPLIVLAALFAVFNAVQLAVLFGGYDAVLEKTGQTYAEYARQGFWQLLLVTLLTLLVIVFALRWAPRDSSGDWTLVRAVLGTLCVLALVVVASAVRRMDMYVEAYGLTRLRISVVTVELWLGLVIVLIMAAGVWGARWLPRAVLASAAAGVLAFGLVSPDALIAERNVQRYEAKGSFDLDYARGLSADAAPALDKLDEPLRSCALRSIAQDLEGADKSWYATSLGEARARDILDGRPLSPDADWNVCNRLGTELAYR